MKKKTLIIALLAVVAVMGIGFSILSTNLRIQGTASVDNSFDVEIVGIERVNYKTNDGIGAAAVGPDFLPGEAVELSAPTYTANTATFNVRLGLASSITYLITVENKGTMVAQLKNVTINKSENSDIEVTMPININNKMIAIGKKAYFLVTMSYPYTDDLKGNGSEISVEFDARQATDYANTNQIPLYLVKPGSVNYDGTRFPVEIVGLDSNENIGGSANALELYVSIDGGDFTALGTGINNEFTRVNKFDKFGGIYYNPSAELNDGTLHTIKIKLYDKAAYYYTNEITYYYQNDGN